MKLLLNADDFGLTRSGTDTILDCIDKGFLNGVSIVPNGPAFDYAISEAVKRGAVSLGIHINLIEGRPVSPPERVPLLVNQNGYFCYGFPGLWKALVTGSKKTQEKLRAQIRREIYAQINKCYEATGGNRPFRLDSHMHVHMIPSVFDVLLEFVDQYAITYVRIPHERLINARIVSVNGVKQLLLRLLSIPAEKKLDARGAGYCRQFVGILYSGKMHQLDLSLILERFSDERGMIEVLFHPGGGTSAEIASSGIRFGDFYRSKARLKEARATKRLKKYIQ